MPEIDLSPYEALAVEEPPVNIDLSKYEALANETPLHERINDMFPESSGGSTIKADNRGWIDRNVIEPVFGRVTDPVDSILSAPPNKRASLLAKMDEGARQKVQDWIDKAEQDRYANEYPNATKAAGYSQAISAGGSETAPFWLRELQEAKTPERRAALLVSLKQAGAQARSDEATTQKDRAEAERQKREDYAAALQLAKRLPDNPGDRMLIAAATQFAGDMGSLMLRPLDLAGSDLADRVQEGTKLRQQANVIRNEEQFVNPWAANVAPAALASMGEMIPGVAVGNLAKARGAAELAKVLPAAFGGLNQANQSISEGRKAGLSGKDLAGYVVAQGASEALFEYIPLLKGVGVEAAAMRESAARGFADATKEFLKDQGAEQLGEFSTSLTQAVIDRVSGVNPDALTPDNLYQTIRDTAFSTAIMGGISGPNLIKQGAASLRSRKTSPSTTNTEAVAWAKSNPDAAALLSEKETPSRKDFREAGLPKMDGAERADFAKQVKAALAVQQGGVTAVEDQGLTETPLVDREGAPGEPQKAPVPRKRFEQESDIVGREIAGTTLTPENMPEVAEKMLPFQSDAVTGLPEGRVGNVRYRVAERAQKHVAETGEKGWYVLSDVKNLGGLNETLGDVEANKVFRNLADIFKKELGLPDADVHLFRHGGDEISAVVVNAPQEAVKSAMRLMSEKAQQYVKEAGLDKIRHPKHPDDLTRRGTGLTIKAREIKSDESINDTFAITGKELELSKKGKDHGDAGTPEGMGAGTFSRQAGRVGGGTETPSVGVLQKAPERAEDVRPGRSGRSDAGTETGTPTGQEKADRSGATGVRGEQAGSGPLGGAEERAGGEEDDATTGLKLHRETVRAFNIKVDPSRFQFKRNTNPKTGVKEGQAITGKTDPVALGTFILYEDTDGQKWMVSGHHRMEKIRRGMNRNIDAWILREKDGWTPAKARAKGAEVNILENGGDVDDYAAYFHESKTTHDQAKESGLLRLEKGRQGFAIGTQASQNTYDLFVNGKLSTAQAQTIADAAPGNDAVQAAIVNHLSSHRDMTDYQLETFARYAASQAGESSGGGSGQGSLFGGIDDSIVIANMAKESKVASRKARELRAEANALKGAANKPDVLAKHGVDVKDPKAIQRRMDELSQEASEWDEFWKYPERSKEVRKLSGTDYGLFQKKEESPPPGQEGAAGIEPEHPEKSSAGSAIGFPSGIDTAAMLTGGEAPADLVQAADITRYIKNQFLIPLRGKATFNKKAAGWYSPDTKEIRQKDVRDITVAMHELGHHIDWTLNKRWSLNPPSAEIKAELVRLGHDLYGDKTPAGGYRSEGWAEFIREFLTGGDIQGRAPHLYAWFTGEYLQKNRELAKKLHRLEEMVSAFKMQGAEGRVKAFMQPLKRDWSLPRLWGRMAAWADTNIRDANLRVRRSMIAAGIDPAKLRPSQDTYELMTLVKGKAAGTVKTAISNATMNLAGTERTGDGLAQVLLPLNDVAKQRGVYAGDIVEQWEMFAAAMNAVENYHKKGKIAGISRADAETIIKKYDCPEFRKVLEDATSWNHRILHLMVEGGRISEEAYQEIVKNNSVYVPFERQFEEGEIRADKKAGGGAGLHQRKGSGREINKIIDTMIRRAEQTVIAANEGRVLRSLVNLYDENKGKEGVSIANLITEVSAPKEAVTLSAEQIGKDTDEAVTVYVNAKEYRGKDNILSIDLDGQRRWFEVDPEVYKVLKKLNEKGSISGTKGEIVRYITGLQRLGATGLAPTFGFVTNLIKDAGTASVTFEYAQGGPLAIVSAIKDLSNENLMRKYHWLGLDLAGYIGQDKKKARRLAKEVTAFTAKQKAKNVVTSPAEMVELARSAIGATEILPRIAEFQAAMEYAKKQEGWTAEDVMVFSGNASQDVTVNFTRKGELVGALNDCDVFFNASVQSLDKAGRTFWKHPVRTFARSAGYFTVANLIAYFLWNRDDKEWEEMPPYEKWSYFHGKLPVVGRFRIPLPYEFGLAFGSLPIAALEELRGKTGAFKEALEFFLEQTTPGNWKKIPDTSVPVPTPSVIAPIFEALANEDWKGAPIVPKRTEGRLPEDKYDSQTTELSKKLGAMTGTSPAIIDHLVNGYTGKLYGRMVGMFDHVGDLGYYAEQPANIPVFGTLFPREGSSRVVNDFYDKANEVSQKVASKKATLEEIGLNSESQSLIKKELAPLWKDYHAAQAQNNADGRVKMKAIQEKVQEAIREFNKMPAADLEKRGIGRLAFSVSEKDESKAEESGAYVREKLSGVEWERVTEAMRAEGKRQGYKTATHDDDGDLTAFGRRVMRAKRRIQEK